MYVTIYLWQETDESILEPDSNFIQVLQALLDEHQAEFNISNMSYISPAVQNELLQLMASQIIRQVAEDIAQREFYSIMLDESSDRANKEQMCFLLRWECLKAVNVILIAVLL